MIRRCPNCSEIMVVKNRQVKYTCGYHAYVDKKKPDFTPFSSFRHKSNEAGGKKGVQD